MGCQYFLYHFRDVKVNPLKSEAFKKLDLLVVHDMFMTETAELAHYVLPACSHLEKWGVAYTYNVCHCVPFLMLRKKCIEPLGESRSDYDIFAMVAKRLGFYEKFSNGGLTELDWVKGMGSQFLAAGAGLLDALTSGIKAKLMAPP